MATAYSNAIPAPAFMEADGTYSHEGYDARIAQYRADTEDYLRRAGYKGSIVGKVIYFPVADGYAAYMLATLTKWIHLDEVDGYQASAAAIRGMRAVDTKQMIES